MPICIPNNLPAYKTLIDENIFVMESDIALHQDIRPLEVAILNLMPKKIETETQVLRLLSNTPIQVNIDLLQVKSHKSKNTSEEHLLTFYKTIDQVCNKRYDALIVTGAPVETLPFDQVDYWQEICEIFEWAETHVYSKLYICWAAQAALYYHYGVPKYELPKKAFGIFPHTCLKPNNRLLKGFDELFYAPHSRHTELRAEDIQKVPQLEILTSSEMSGVHIVCDVNKRKYFITGHFEYDRDTLANEYFRDVNKGLEIDVPYNYFPDDDPSKEPLFTWRCHANLLFSNWLNYCVYQKTPFNLEELELM